ncbi:Uncharacterised protein [Vibrio cholerae]|nr:Uncharacterised protein [Vibrio cholerae]
MLTTKGKVFNIAERLLPHRFNARRRSTVDRFRQLTNARSRIKTVAFLQHT